MTSPTNATRVSERRTTVTLVRRFEWWDYLVYSVLTVFHVMVLGIVLASWTRTAEWGPAQVALPLLLLSLVLQVGLWEWRWLTLPLMRMPVERAAASGWRVGIAVTFVPGAESIEMLEETVGALVAIRYPHDTWVLDEGDDAAVRDLCARHGVHHFSRRGIERYQQAEGPYRSKTKYGNYNAWLDTHGYGSYDLITAVDSDHILCADYLDRVLGCFDDDGVAFVQPAQAYYNQRASLVARGAAEETYAYYSSILMAAQGVGYPLVVGCHNTHRVTAVKEIGGFPPHEADDMVMTLLYRERGWRGVFVPRILARGLVPADWASYLAQQRRWARSVLDYKFRVFPRHGMRLPAFERLLNYLHGLYYLRGIVIAAQIVLLVLVLATGIVPPGRGGWFVRDVLLVVGALLVCDLYRQRFFLGRAERGIHWRSQLISQVKWPWFVLAAIDAMRGRYGEYVITAKNRAVAMVSGKRSSSVSGFVRTHAAVILVVALAWAVGNMRGSLAFIALHIGAGLTVAISIIAILMARTRPVPAYDPTLRATWDEGAEPVRGQNRV